MDEIYQAIRSVNRYDGSCTVSTWLCAIAKRVLRGYILRHEEKLIPLLSEEAKAIYEKIRDNQEELRSLDECEAFHRGFRLGARIAYETMEGTDVPSIDD